MVAPVVNPPICYHSVAEFELWKESARHIGGMNLRAGFCVDCTKEFQAKMIREHRCTNPNVEFRIDEDGFVEGYVPSLRI